ncbi:MAG TPA: hypothetical protein VG326_01360 [Tepidisphaeraceae bacterium]|jgi:hypothetical protein|nr:hypothetical protein [Tepidisphaeraceae bacterium]
MTGEKVKTPPHIADQFDRLADQWALATSILSSPTQKAMHPAYREIVAMGLPALPMILQRMEHCGGHWFWALSEITGENPIPISAHGRIAEMREAWLKWGRERGYC